MAQAVSRLVALFCLYSTCQAQINARFIEHLSLNGLATEHKKYLETFSASDSVHYFTAAYYLKYFDSEKFLENYMKAEELCSKDRSMEQEGGVKFLRQNDTMASRRWFSRREKVVEQPAFGPSAIYRTANNPNDVKPAFVPGHLQESFLNYKKQFNKNPVLAASLSAVVPGSGKLYAGKARSSLMTFLLHVGYALQTWESSRKLGTRHPLTIINTAAFGVFYFSNIYGSYTSVTEQKRKYKLQFIHDATEMAD